MSLEQLMSALDEHKAEPYIGSAKANPILDFNTRWLLVHQPPAQPAQKGNLKPCKALGTF